MTEKNVQETDLKNKSGKVIVQFRKNGKRVTTKTIGSETEALFDFEAVLKAENILQQLVENRTIIGSGLQNMRW